MLRVTRECNDMHKLGGGNGGCCCTSRGWQGESGLSPTDQLREVPPFEDAAVKALSRGGLKCGALDAWPLQWPAR